jgi:acyl carrier protein
MGLDVVELTLRCEEEFDVALENDRLERVRTVGDLFELICEKLGLPCGPDALRPIRRTFVPLATGPSEAWTRDSVWIKLVQIIIDQLQVDEEDVTYHASFLDDLGAD